MSESKKIYRVQELRRFRMLLAGLYCGIAVSTPYTFSVYTSYFRTQYNFNQKDITNISTVGTCFGFFNFPAGVLFDLAGPQAVLAVSGVFGFLGFLLFGLTINGIIPASVASLCVFNAILYLGCQGIDVAVVMPLLLNFPIDQGMIVIIQNTFSGLGTSFLFIYLNGWLLQGDGSYNLAAYSYFAGAHILLCAMVGFAFIRMPSFFLSTVEKKMRTPAEVKRLSDGSAPFFMTQHAPFRRFIIGFVLVGGCVVFTTVQSLAIAYSPTTQGGYIAISVVAVVLIAMFSLMAMPFQFLGRYAVLKDTDIPGIGLVDSKDEYFSTPTYGALKSGANMDAEEMQPSTRNSDNQDERPVENTSLLQNNAQGAVGQRSATEPFGDELRLQAPLADKEETGDDLAKKDDPSMALDVYGNELAEVDKEMTPSQDAEGQAEQDEPENRVLGEPQYPMSFWRNLLSIELWCLWLTCFGMWGTGVVMNANSYQMYAAINKGHVNNATFSLYITMISVGSALGRVIIGVCDMLMSARRRNGRFTVVSSWLLPIPPFVMAISFLFFAVLPGRVLLLPFLLCAIGNGASWGIGILVIRQMYAIDLGKHYNFCFSSGILSTIALNRFTFGQLFDNESAKSNAAANTCTQPSCVRNSMLIFMAINFFCTFTAIVTHWRYLSFVKKTICEREGTSSL